MQNIPKTTKGVITQPDGTVSYSEMPIPELTEDQVLVKVHSSPIHRLDFLTITGAFPDPRPNLVQGALRGPDSWSPQAPLTKRRRSSTKE